MHEMKLRVQVLRPASGQSRVARVDPCHWSEGRHNYVGVSLCTGNVSHNASNARGVTAGKMGRNSSLNNKVFEDNNNLEFTTRHSSHWIKEPPKLKLALTHFD